MTSPVKLGKPPPPPPITADTKLNRVPFPHENSDDEATGKEVPMQTDANGGGDADQPDKDAEKLPKGIHGH